MSNLMNATVAKRKMAQSHLTHRNIFSAFSDCFAKFPAAWSGILYVNSMCNKLFLEVDKSLRTTAYPHASNVNSMKLSNHKNVNYLIIDILHSSNCSS